MSHDVAVTTDVLHDMDVDDLLKYINGDNKTQAKMTTRKAAKRARQKQRKVAPVVSDLLNIFMIFFAPLPVISC